MSPRDPLFGARRAPKGPRISRRAALLFGAQALAMGGLVLRMRELQVEEAERYRTLAEENRINIRLIPPARGRVLDRTGRPLADNRQNYRVVVIPEEAGDVEEVLDRLALLVDITPRQRARALREIRSKRSFVPVTVAEYLDWESFARVNANAPALAGVSPEVGLTRVYPEADALAHIVGYVGPVNDRELTAVEEAGGPLPLFQLPDFRIGKSGVEKEAEDTLRGAAGSSRIEVNAVGRVIREIDRDEGEAGADIKLTIDLDLQRYATRRLAGESAAAVVMDVRTGDLLALGSAPAFDPNKFVVGINQTDWNALLNDEYRPLANKFATGMYPPGSTFKMLVGLAALEAGVVGPRETVWCPGRYKLGNRWFHCWKRGGHGWVDHRDALKESCDVYFYEVAKRVGVDAIAEMARKFGLGEAPDLPLNALRGGNIPTKAWKRQTYDEGWQIGDTLNTGIGQGYVLATPLQLAIMTARLAGDGAKIAPRLVASIGGVPTERKAAEPLGVSPRHLRMAREGMFAVSNERRGTAWRMRIADPEMLMAGKTGTSQVRRITAAERARGVTRNEDLPWNRRDHALFVGFAPYDAPRYAVSVLVEHGGGGSRAAAPIGRDLMMRALYGGEPPLEAYPAALRDEIRREREANPDAAEANERQRA